jgi:hypothetical protein
MVILDANSWPLDHETSLSSSPTVWAHLHAQPSRSSKGVQPMMPDAWYQNMHNTFELCTIVCEDTSGNTESKDCALQELDYCIMCDFLLPLLEISYIATMK